jgi:hypothetical protein
LTLEIGLTKLSFEFVIEVPLTLVSTRTTHFEKITHQLHAAVLDNTPCYDHLLDGSATSTLSSLIRRLGSKQTISSVFGPTPTLACAIEPINVFSCGSQDADTIYNWRYSSEMDGLGDLTVALDSQQFTLGGSADLSVDLTALSPSTTIHAITASLVQTTARPACPFKYSAAKGIPVDVAEGNTELLDKYQLYSYGTSWSRMPGRIRPFHGSYIWRGAEGVQYVRDSLGENDLLVDRSHPDGFGLCTTLSLPSPIIGAHPTTVDENPAFSTISHHLELQFEYSVLNQDIRGDLISNNDSEPTEGSVRTWTLEKSLHIHSDLSSASSTAAPPYSPSPTPSRCHTADLEPPMELRSTKALRYISLGMTKATLMRPVAFDAVDLEKATNRHREETAGMCACFDGIRVCRSGFQGDEHSLPNEHSAWAGKMKRRQTGAVQLI